MSTEIVMPNLGFDTQEGLLVEWLKQPGDAVRKGEVIAIIESDKANVELESVAGGRLLEQLYAAGDTVPVGATIARIGSGDAPAAAAAPTPIEATPVARRLAAENAVELGVIAGSGPRGRILREDVEAYLTSRTAAAPANGAPIRALPKVRKAAREAGVDLARVTPTGPLGSVTLADLAAYRTDAITHETTVVAAAPAPQPAAAAATQAELLPDGVREIALSRARQVIGRRLGESMREAPHFYVTGEFDLEAAVAGLKLLPPPEPGINDLLQYLAVQALRRVPELNATFAHGRLLQYDAVHLAIAVARDDGLITPVLRKADRYSLTGLAAESRELVQRARANRLSPDELQGGTFTISNLGVIRQVDQFTAVINPPQVAILAVGTVKQRPLIIDGGLHIRHTVHLTLSGDHRVVDGMHLGRFMAAFQDQLNYFVKGKHA